MMPDFVLLVEKTSQIACRDLLSLEGHFEGYPDAQRGEEKFARNWVPN